ncbi:MAG: MBL fold metallo-hydrolase [Acholeplasmataceae bacterium]|jgi:glyoxylase-like metal-dependent hydrolase (beta-lactamase superfamily II)|nr:MBL fold metallo-hydrolase [Acholeplasmataceae bacterium]
MKTFKGNDDIAHTYLICRFGVCFLVDPVGKLDDIKKEIGENRLEAIILTHAHNDHVDLIGEFDAPIYVHKDDAHLLFEDKYNGYHPKNHPYKKKDLKLVLVDHQYKIPFADSFILVIHTPGHTKGSVAYLYQDKLFTGDTLFKDSVGRHDLYSGNLSELKKSVIDLLSLSANIKIYPGHDEQTTVRQEQKANPFYLKWIKQGNR